jgi:hypothetical protein
MEQVSGGVELVRGGDGTDVRRMWVRWVVGSRTGVMKINGTGGSAMEQVREWYGTLVIKIRNRLEKGMEQLIAERLNTRKRDMEQARGVYGTG